MIEISASILAANYAKLGEEVKRAEQAGADSIHFDVMDGHYVANLALSPSELRDLKPLTHLPFNLHLEVDNPKETIGFFDGLHPDMIIVQADTCPDWKDVFRLIRAQGAKVGVAVNLEDPITMVHPMIDEIDLLLVMAVHPGFGNQKHNPETASRIAEAHAMLKQAGRKIPIASDGGINVHNAESLIRAGMSHFIMGSSLFNAPDMGEVIRAIKNMA